MKVSIIQPGKMPEAGSQERLDYIRDLILSQDEVDLILLHELWFSGFSNPGLYLATAEALERPIPTDRSPVQLMLSKAASSKHCYLLAGSIITEQEGNFYNTSILFDPDGKIAAYYNKMHLFGYNSIERRLLTNGEHLVTTELSLPNEKGHETLKVGLSICYDLRFPDIFQSMVDMGAEMFLVVGDWPSSRIDHWRLFAQARAVENQSFMIASNRAGHSMVVSPMGIILAEGEDKKETPEIVTCDLDLDQIAQYRDSFPLLKDRVEYSKLDMSN